MEKTQAILFDLDGTLLDTVPDLAYALNLLRKEHQLPPLTIDDVRPIATLGSIVMIKTALNIDQSHPEFKKTREHFLDIYLNNLNTHTQFFDGIEEILRHLEKINMPWGIVTNKLTVHTIALLKGLNYYERPAVIVCGDTLSHCKPHPAPILHACEKIAKDPKHCLYVGDAKTDVIASRAAGTTPIVALYGYTDKDEDPHTWKADGYIEKPMELVKWI